MSDLGVPQNFSETLSGLHYSTEYHLRFAAYFCLGLCDLLLRSPELIVTTEPEPTNPPALTTGSASQLSYTTAHLSGTVDPQGGNQTSGGDPIPLKWHFQYSPEPEYYWLDGPGGEITGAEAEGSGPIAVAADASGLENHRNYSYRLVADYGGVIATAPEPNPSFETLQITTTPAASMSPVTAITTSAAHFSGQVNPEAPGAAPQDPGFDTEWRFSCSPECPGLTGGTVVADNGSHEVSVNATGLEPGTQYQVTLEATNRGGTTTETKSFTTKAPLASVQNLPGGSDGQGGYALEGVVNAHNDATATCTFEYGPIVPYAFQAPCSPDPSGFNGNKPVTVEAHVTGLTAGATYHSRLVVTNSAGPADGGDQIFVPTLTPPQGCANETLRTENSSLALPECRAYEMVTSPNKGGNDAYLSGFYEGKSVAWWSNAGNIEGSGQGDIFRSFYTTNRTDHGWQTLANLNGPTGSLYSGTTGFKIPIMRPSVFAEDLQRSIWFLPAEGANSERGKRPWLRNPDGSFSEVGAGPANSTEPRELLFPDGAEARYSADLSHMAFNGSGGFGSTSNFYGPGVYEFVGTGNGAPRRVDLDNLGDPITECSEAEAAGRVARNNEISSDGRVITFTVNGGCEDGGPKANEIWSRVDGTTAYDASASLCTRTSGDPGGVCNAPSKATYAGAAADGSRVFFTTNQQLVNGDTDETRDIYACDMPSGTPAPGKAANPCAPLSEVSGAATGAKVDQVVRISHDGSSLYFLSPGVLASNEDALGETAQGGDHNLYLWQKDADHPDGETAFVGRLDENDIGTNGADAPQVTNDGRYLLVTTSTALVSSDTDSARDLYRYDADTNETSRLSVNTLGTGGNSGSNARIRTSHFGNGEIGNQIALPNTALPHPSISEDGSKVVFITKEALSPVDGNDANDVYIWNGGRTSLITTASVGSMDTTQQGLQSAQDAVIDSSGQDVYFVTPQRLSPADGDDVDDVYDARIGGGFKSPVANSCSGEACQPAASATPAAPAPASAAGGSEGNVKPKHCGKAKTLVKNKCVKKKAKKHQKKGKRSAGHGGGK